VSARKAAGTKAAGSKSAAPKKAATSKTAAAAAPPAALVVDPAQLELLPRPMPSAEVMAVITAASQLVWPRPALPDAENPVHDAWRFSGRWWAQPAARRRARPWARR
jgi:hypothetical protein